MRLSKQASGRSAKSGLARIKNRRRCRLNAASRQAAVQALEPRRMFDGEYISTAITPVLANAANPAANSITLNQHFNDTTLPGTLVTFQTTEGEIQVGLTDAATPQTVANFLSYVESGAYNGTIFHRSIDLNTGVSANGTDNGTIIQGGGYNLGSGGLTHIPVNSPVSDEYTTEIYGDVAGTLAMAKTSEADSATSEWYFNVTDNTELDTPTTDSSGASTSYTVFGEILGQSSYTTLTNIADLPTVSSGGLDSIPVSGLTEAQIQAGASANGNNLIYVDSVTQEAGTSYVVNSSNPSLVTPKVTNGVLSFTYGAGFGTANVTITGTNLDGTSTSTNVLVTVPNPALPSGSGPTVADTTAPFTVTGTAGNIVVLGGDTDSIAALDPSTVNIVTGPSHGTASVNNSNGQIIYTPTAGYIGADTLTYTVSDTDGNVSQPATVTLSSVPTPLQITVGTGGINSLVFTQPNGFTGTMTVINGTALVTFTSYQVNATPAVKGVVHASGAGCVITNVTVTNTKLSASLNVKATGPITLGSINDTARLTVLNAPQASITGDCNIGGGMNRLVAASLSNVNLTLGRSGVDLNILVPIVTNTSINDSQTIASIVSNNWVITDGKDHSITAPSIDLLNIKGDFPETLNLDPASFGLKSYALFDANVTQPSGTWNISGSMYRAVLGSPGANWVFNASGIIETMIIKGNLANNIEAAAIATLTVSGTTNDATIQTSAPYDKKSVDIRTIKLSGAVTNSVVYSPGSITSFSALSMTNSRIYVGVNTTIAEDGELAAATTDFTSAAKLSSVTLTSKAANAFSQSLISADIIGSLKLGKINTNNGGNPEGVSAVTFSSVSGTLVPGGVLAASGKNIKTAAALAAYEKAKKLTLGDFELNII